MKEINQWIAVPPALLLCCCGAEATAKNDTTSPKTQLKTNVLCVANHLRKTLSHFKDHF